MIHQHSCSLLHIPHIKMVPVPEQQETIHMIQMLRKETCSGSIADLSHIRTQWCLADCLTKKSANPQNLIDAVRHPAVGGAAASWANFLSLAALASFCIRFFAACGPRSSSCAVTTTSGPITCNLEMPAMRSGNWLQSMWRTQSQDARCAHLVTTVITMMATSAASKLVGSQLSSEVVRHPHAAIGAEWVDCEKPRLHGVPDRNGKEHVGFDGFWSLMFHNWLPQLRRTPNPQGKSSKIRAAACPTV